jgi:hypothetical protein
MLGIALFDPGVNELYVDPLRIWWAADRPFATDGRIVRVRMVREVVPKISRCWHNVEAR